MVRSAAAERPGAVFRAERLGRGHLRRGRDDTNPEHANALQLDGILGDLVGDERPADDGGRTAEGAVGGGAGTVGAESRARCVRDGRLPAEAGEVKLAEIQARAYQRA